jgi:hypothetical protein
LPESNLVGLIPAPLIRVSRVFTVYTRAQLEFL